MAEKRQTGDAEARRLPDSFRGEPPAVAHRPQPSPRERATAWLSQARLRRV